MSICDVNGMYLKYIAGDVLLDQAGSLRRFPEQPRVTNSPSLNASRV